jgi:hypothetical protein
MLNDFMNVEVLIVDQMNAVMFRRASPLSDLEDLQKIHCDRRADTALALAAAVPLQVDGANHAASKQGRAV